MAGQGPRFDLPAPDPETQPFWDAARAGRLLIRRCRDCGRFHFYPRPFCPVCWSTNVEWVEAGGGATLYTWSVVRRNDLRLSTSGCRTWLLSSTSTKARA